VAESLEFERLAGPFRAELLAYCYRMLGSVQDAEDQVQETLLRAWRGRRPLPSGLGGPAQQTDTAPGAARTEVPWLEPVPDAWFGTVPADPAAVVVSRTSMRLALIAPAEDDIREPASPADREFVGRYAAAFENADLTALARMLRDGGYTAHGICVLTLAGTRVARIVSFNDPGLFAGFGFPPRLPAGEREPVPCGG
jgi:Sigma-70 region 2